MEDSETMNGSNKRSTRDHDDDRDHRDHLHHRGMQKKLRYPRDCVCSVREFAKKLDEWMFRNGQVRLLPSLFLISLESSF